MSRLKEFDILGLPIETPIGNLRFLKVQDYPKCHEYLNAIRMTKDHIVKLFYDNGVDDETLKVLKELSLYELVMQIADIKHFYVEILEVMCDDEFEFDLIEEQTFYEIRKLILETCVIKEEKINPNPEIQSWIEKSKRFKAQMGGDMTFSDIITSVSVGCSLTYEEINNLTIYQLYSNFYRIGHFKNYDTTTLFATVASDKIDIESWSKNIDMLAEEKHGHSRDEFDKMGSNVF